MAGGNGASQVISLPKGGGAQSGIGETFSADLHTGTGNFSVPIALPPGRNGFQPELSLVYSTGNGNGPFGLGWSLSVPGVSRKTSKGVPRYDDARDTFVLSGAEDLVPVEVDGPRTRYQPRTEGLFARIDHHRDAANDFWEVRSKDGLVSRYGTEGVAGSDPAVVADPANRRKVFAWKLTETRDPFGNRIVYEYERDTGEEGPHHWDRLYLRRIRYVDLDGGRFLVSVDFEYSDLASGRPDPFSEYRPGFEIRTRRRCKRIVIRTHGQEELLVRSYELVYLDERVASGELPEAALPHNRLSLLNQVRVVGHDERQREEDGTEPLPPLEFGYTRFEPQIREFQAIEGCAEPAQSLASPDLELVDLFGNGLPDLFEMNGTVRYWRNLGTGRFDLPRPMRDAPAGLQLAAAGAQLVDADGDGRTDLLATSEGLFGYFPLSFQGEWDRRSFRPYKQAPSFSFQDPEVQLVDVDGDGVTDAVRSGARFEYFFNDPLEGWNHTRRVERQGLDVFPNVNFSDPRVRFADMAGDGLQDIVLVHDGNIEYWPNLGHGDWGKRVHMRASPRFPFGYDPRRILIGDVDGDGLADLVFIDHCKVVLYLNQSGNRWSEPIEIGGTPAVTDQDAVRLVDILGTGVPGVLWSKQGDALGRPRMFFLDFTGGVKPYLLNEMNNHMGAVTRVEYAPSTRFYLEDQRDPRTRWKSTLPFPVQVVARVEVIDEISRGKLTTEYRYRHGYWDGAEREFRGFGRVDQRDTEVFAEYHAGGLHPEREFEPVSPRSFSPPTETRTWFHQGPIGEEFGDWFEADYRDELWPGDPQLLERPAAFLAPVRELEIPSRDKRRAMRDAVRALRGVVLRTELYALDGSERQDRPFTVTEHLHDVHTVAAPAAPGDSDGRAGPGIFFPHPVAQRVTQWERGDDPLTQFTFVDYRHDNGAFDEVGRPLSQTQVACPRGWRAMHDRPLEPYLATRTRTAYAEPVDPAVYIRDRVARVTTFELVGIVGRRVRGLAALPDDSASLRVVGQTLSFYDGEAFVGRAFGEAGAFGALVRSESLVLTEEILHEAYGSGDTVLAPPEMPPYLDPAGSPTTAGGYPQEFLKLLPNRAGYVFRDAGAEHVRGYFVSTARHRYDFHADLGGAGRGILITTRDPLGDDTGDRDTTIEYAFDLLPTRVRDPVGLETMARYDERVLQPAEVIDPNGNRTRFAYSPLGLLRSTAVMGKPAENVGDTEEVPGTRFEYDFAAFAERRGPISVRTIQRVHHANPIDLTLADADETIEALEFSDGFGRLVQTRAQAEDTTYGDPVFGGSVLPADQSQPAGDAVGRRRAPGDPVNVVVSGWQVYDNKGQVVEKFEPFFSQGFAYLSPEEEHARSARDVLGQKVAMFYDPRGQVVRTVNPDGSEQRVAYGVPVDLRDPDRFRPTPWEVFTYDANDLAPMCFHPSETLPDGIPKPLTHRAPAPHHFTPVSIAIDALGRTVASVERNGPDPANDWFTTRSTYDVRGNLLTVTDAIGRVAFRYAYDLADNPLRIENIDAGVRRIVLDAAGNEIERRDSKGALVVQAYDLLQRPTHLWARDDAISAPAQREHLIYGDRSDPAQPAAEREANRAANRLGALHEHYDEAGWLVFERYDFKGNVLEKVRHVISDEAILAVFNPPRSGLLGRLLDLLRLPNPPPNWEVPALRINWEPPSDVTLAAAAGALLDPFEYRTSATYDALNRVKAMLYPRDVQGQRKELRPRYNRSGALEGVVLVRAPQVEEVFLDHVAYDAKGQRTLIALGNGVMTRYAYDPRTFRLARLRSEGYTKPSPDTPIYERAGSPLQDFAYEYDLAGNITTIHDRTPQSGVPNTLLGRDALDRGFTYDPLYRLLSATGREHDRPPQASSRPPWLDEIFPGSQDPTKTRAYTQRYRYDPLGNLMQLRHIAASGSFTRNFGLVPGTNRLASLVVGNGSARTFAYQHDDNGNLIRENTERHFEWDHGGRMKVFRNQVDGGEPSVHAHYLYDASGQRGKKLVRKHGGNFEMTVYIDGLFEHHRWRRSGAPPRENNHLHVMDDQQRIALIRVGGAHPDDKAPPVQYHLGDHLGSSNVVADEQGSVINREAYTPYGETSFGSFAKKRYRFTGRERDEESGASYHNARFYSPGNGRWLSVDPEQDQFPQWSPFCYALANPTGFVDPTGTEPDTITVYHRTGERQAKGMARVGIREIASRSHVWLGEGFYASSSQNIPDVTARGSTLIAVQIRTDNVVDLTEELGSLYQENTQGRNQRNATSGSRRSPTGGYEIRSEGSHRTKMREVLRQYPGKTIAIRMPDGTTHYVIRSTSSFVGKPRIVGALGRGGGGSQRQGLDKQRSGSGGKVGGGRGPGVVGGVSGGLSIVTSSTEGEAGFAVAMVALHIAAPQVALAIDLVLLTAAVHGTGEGYGDLTLPKDAVKSTEFPGWYESKQHPGRVVRPGGLADPAALRLRRQYYRR